MNTMQERFPIQLNSKIDRRDGRGQGSKRFSCKHRRSFKHGSAVATEEFLLAFWSCLEGGGNDDRKQHPRKYGSEYLEKARRGEEFNRFMENMAVEATPPSEEAGGRWAGTQWIRLYRPTGDIISLP